MATARPHKSIKHLIIDKANTTIIITVSIAVFIVVFCAFSVKALFSQSLYQQRVISEKQTALRILKENKEAANELRETYESFATESINVLGGNPTGDGPLDGDNAKIVLDALPSEYDYPALSSSIEKILLEGGYKIKEVGGQEDTALNTESADTPSVAVAVSETIDIIYPFTVEAPPEATLQLLKTFEASIRPFKINSLVIKGQGANLLTTEIDLTTYYKPVSGLQVSTKEIK